MPFEFVGIEPPNENKFVFEGVEEPDEGNAPGRLAAQSAIGLGKGATFAGPAAIPAALAEFSFHPAVQNVISELLESDIEQQQMFPGQFPALNREALEKGAEQAEQKYLGGEGLVGGLISAPFRAAGIETEPKTGPEKAIRGISELFSLLRSGKADPESLKKALGGALSGEAATETAKSWGLPDWFSSLLGIGVGAAVPNIKPSVSIPKKSPSGLTEPKAVEAKTPSKGRITKYQQESSINKLNEEASKLFEKKISARIPLKERIEKGENFYSEYEERFGKLKSAAQKSNPEINITPTHKFLRDSISDFKGVRKLDPEAASIVKEYKSFSKNPTDSLNELLNTYRSNNRKLKLIRDQAKLKGTRDKYVSFLEGFNKSISDSIEKTLPENSQWVKEFKASNADYSQFKKSIKALDQLEPILGDVPNPQSVKKLATNINAQKKLSLYIGKEGSSEIVQIAKDLDKATNAIRKIPVKDWKVWEKYLPFSLLFPGHGIALGGATAIIKAHDLSKRLYGSILLRPSTRKLYSEAITALESQDLKKYLSVTQELSDDLSKIDNQ